MLGKAIIATILGAGVTGGAVYLAANPELLEGGSADKTQTEMAAPDITPASAEPALKDNPPVSKPDTKPEPKSEPIVIEPSDPVLPKAKQLTTATPVTAEPTSEPDAAAAAAEQARRVATADLRRIMAQADRMASPDLRDQAYLSAVEFALSNTDYRGADTAMKKLSQPQLRDTARSKIAVKYAKAGQTDRAFKVIDQVEIDDLRDFMRLQVIEAVTRDN